MNITPYGQACVLLQLTQEITNETHDRVHKIYLALTSLAHKGITSVIPSYCSLAIKYDVSSISYTALKELLKSLEYETITLPLKQEHIIPVCYHESLALDRDHVCQHTLLSPEEIIALHTAPSYPIYAIGFVPGFFYLGGLAPQLHIPRKEVPRLKVPKGSVGIAAKQTGVYPLATPGGWQVIGRTPISLFDPKQPDKYRIGDTIRFKAIDLSTYKKHVGGLEIRD